MIRKFKALYAAWLAHMLAYRAEIILWIFTGTVPLIMLAVWVNKAQQSGGTLNGFDAADFAQYFLWAWFCQQATVAWVAWEMEYEIRMGTLSAKLMRPLNPFWEHLMRHLTERTIRMPVVILIVLAGAWVVPNTQLVGHWTLLPVFVLGVVLAFVIRYCMSFCIGVMCFWMNQSTALESTYYFLSLVLAGSFAPLDFYPPALRAVIEYTPFPYIVYYPARLITGDVENVAYVLGMQVLWVAVFALLARVLWVLGLKKYGAVGA